MPAEERRNRSARRVLLLALAGTARAAGPSFDCGKVRAASRSWCARIRSWPRPTGSWPRSMPRPGARYRLLPPIGTATYACDGQPGDEVTATYFATDPPTAIAERGDQVSLLYQQPSGNGAKCQGRNETLWENQGEAMITWGYGSPDMRCRVKR